MNKFDNCLLNSRIQSLQISLYGRLLICGWTVTSFCHEGNSSTDTW